jgi:hypothetical protein
VDRRRIEMRFAIEAIVFVVSVGLAYSLGKMEIARFVWNLLSNRRTEGMAEAVCLYCAVTSPSVMRRNGWKCVNDVYLAIKNKKELVDSI